MEKLKKWIVLLLITAITITGMPELTIQSFASKVNEEIYSKNGITVDFKINSEWNTGMEGQFIITNNSDMPLENWRLKFTYSTEITSIWDAKIESHKANVYVIKYPDWNSKIVAGGKVVIGFNGKVNSSQSKVPKNCNLLSSENSNMDTAKEDYTITYKTTSDWKDAFNGEISIKNNTLTPIEGWSLEFDFDRDIKQLWNAKKIRQEANHYIIRNDEWNSVIKPGETIKIGFEGSPGNQSSEPQNYNLKKIALEEENQEEEVIDLEKDSDEDGLSDYIESQIGTDGNKKDTDGDGLDDFYEYIVTETNPLNKDTDGNGISDGEEDFDSDGLKNSEECQYDTSPFDEDTDGDGLSDKEEIFNYKTNPLLYDTDEDGLSDGQEVNTGLNPLSKTSHEGIPDAEYSVVQELKKEVFESINTEDSPYVFTADISTAGEVSKSIKALPSAYTEVFSDNRAILGDAVDLSYAAETIKEAKIKFEIKTEYRNNIGSPYAESSSELKGIKRFHIFEYDTETNLLIPLITTHNEETNTISAQTKELGTYLVMDMEKWFYDLGIKPATSVKKSKVDVKTDILGKDEKIDHSFDETEEKEILPVEYIPISPEQLKKEINQLTITNKSRSVTIHKPVDIVLVVDATMSMAENINLTKTYLGSMTSLLYQAGVTPYISVVAYSDYITHKEDGAKVIKKKDGSIWANNQNDVVELLSQIEIVGGKNETPIDALEMGRRLKFRSGAEKFVILLTNESYSIENRYGIKSIEELSQLFEKDNKTVIAITKNALKEDYHPLTSVTGGEWFSLYSEYSNDLKDFILNRLKSKKGYSVINGSSMQTMTLNEKPVKGSKVDTDKDGVTDSNEINWDLVKQKETENEIVLPTLKECIKQYRKENQSALDRFGKNYSDKLNQLKILPVHSDPTKKDSDNDGSDDKVDEFPFDRSISKLWYQLEYNGKAAYLSQGMRTKPNDKLIIADINSSKGQLYLYEENEWIDTGKTVKVPDQNKERLITLPFDAVKKITNEFNRQFNKMKKELKKLYMQMGYVASNISKEDWELIYLGAGAGLIDGSFMDKTIFEKVGELEGWDYVNPFKVIPAAIPSSDAIKKAFLKMNGKKESQLEKKYYYLLSKSTMEFIVYLNAEATRYGSMGLAYLAATGGGIAGGVSAGTTGGGMAFSLASGGISITVPVATAIASGALTVSAGLLSLSAKNAGNIADNALNKAKSDLNKLQGSKVWTGKPPTADELAKLANNSKEIDGLQGIKIPYDVALEAGEKFTGSKTIKISNGYRIESKDGTKRFRMMQKIKKGSYEANFEIFKKIGTGKNIKFQKITNYHVEIIKD